MAASQSSLLNPCPKLGDALLDQSEPLGLDARVPARAFVRRTQPDERLQDRVSIDRQEDLFDALIAEIPPSVEGGDDLRRDHPLELDERVVRRARAPLLAYLLGELGDLPHQRIAVGEQLERKFTRLQLVLPAGDLLAGEGANEGLEQCAVEPEIDFRQPAHGGETALVLDIGSDDRAKIGQCAPLETDDPLTTHEFRARGIRRLRRHNRFV